MVSGMRNQTIGMNAAETIAPNAEHRSPAAVDEQPRRDRSADDGAERIAARHEGDGEVSSPRVRELGRHRIARGEHAADADAGEEAERGERRDVVRGRGEPHADRHHDETAEGDGPSPDPVGEAADEDRAGAHADELHREHDRRAPRGRCATRRRCPATRS